MDFAGDGGPAMVPVTQISIPEGPMTAKSSPGLTTPETSRSRGRFSLTICNPRKISCTGRESSGYTNCNAELSTLQKTKDNGRLDGCFRWSLLSEGTLRHSRGKLMTNLSVFFFCYCYIEQRNPCSLVFLGNEF